MQTDRAGQRGSAKKVHIKGQLKKTSELGGDLYVVAVLTFHRCTSGSITPAGKGERKGEAFDCRVLNGFSKEDTQIVFVDVTPRLL